MGVRERATSNVMMPKHKKRTVEYTSLELSSRPGTHELCVHVCHQGGAGCAAEPPARANHREGRHIT